MTLGIVIATYQRIDGTTPKYLETALKSIKSQTHNDYKVYLIGDKYENNVEFENLAKSIITPEKIKWENLPFAKERDKYSLKDKKLWCSGGVSAINYGIEIALSEDVHYLCHLDHDDWWEINHLQEINKMIEKEHYFFICTKSNHINNQILPTQITYPYYPKSSDIVHSSTCINFKETFIRYRDVFEETGKIYPADADLWNRISDFMKKTNKRGIVIDKITCNHITERV
jgi:glycosyltransferase involved in cell wall biosynthesis